MAAAPPHQSGRGAAVGTAAAAAPAPAVHVPAAAGRAAFVSGTEQLHSWQPQCLRAPALLHPPLRALGRLAAVQPLGWLLLLLLLAHWPLMLLAHWRLQRQTALLHSVAPLQVLPLLRLLRQRLLPPLLPWPAAAPGLQSLSARQCGGRQLGSRGRCTCTG